MGIVVFEVLLDEGFELRDAVEHAAADAVLGQAEEALDLVEPGRRSRREVHMEPLVPLEPDPDAGMLVCGVVVGDQVDIKVLWRLGFERQALRRESTGYCRPQPRPAGQGIGVLGRRKKPNPGA